MVADRFWADGLSAHHAVGDTRNDADRSWIPDDSFQLLRKHPIDEEAAMSEQRMDPSAFDAYAAEYDAALEQGISISGEGKEYFARGRILWLKKVLGALGE